MQQDNVGPAAAVAPAGNPNTPLMITMMGGIMAVMIAMVLAVVIAGQHPPQVMITGGGGGGGGGAAPSAPVDGAGGPGVTQPSTPAPPMPEVAVARVDAVPSVRDVFDPAWERAAGIAVPLQPQAMTSPTLEKATVSSIRVQALRDSQRIAWRLTWAAAKPSANVDTGRFSDAVAIQLPLDADTPFTMGGPGKPVRLLHWKALWQKDIDEAFQDVQHVHPNYWADFYWFSEGKFPFPIADSFKNPISRQWLIGVQAGNPMSNFKRSAPVEEIVAEGFGTATSLPDSATSARGEWRDGKWTVVLSRALRPDDALTAALQSGKANMISLAVWDGSAENVGGRKHYCTWIPMKVAP